MMLTTFDSLVVIEHFFQDKFPSSFKKQEDYHGYVAQQTIGEHNYYYVCRIESFGEPVYMIGLSDYSANLSESALYELMIRINDHEKSGCMKMNSSGEWYSYCSQEVSSEPISEMALMKIFSVCQGLLFDFEIHIKRMVEGESSPDDPKLKSMFPYHISDLQGYMAGTATDPWERDADPLDQHEKRRFFFHRMMAYDKFQKKKERQNKD